MGRCSRCVVPMKKISAGRFYCPSCGAQTQPFVPVQSGAPLPVEDITLTPRQNTRGVPRPKPTPLVTG